MKKPNVIRPQVQRWAAGLGHTMNEAGIGYAVADAVRGPQVFTFRLGLRRSAMLKKVVGLEEQLALAMHVEHVRVARHLGYVDVEVALPRGLRRALPVRALSPKGGTWATLGQTPTGTQVHVNLAGTNTCQTLIAGMTGSGKTVAQQLVAWMLAQGETPDRMRYILIDGKGGVTWHGFRREAHLAHPVIGDVGEGAMALTWLLVELDRRKEQGRTSPRIFVIVDEVKELLDGPGGDAIAEAIARLTAVGRELGVHCVLSTQHPTAASVGSGIAKANLPLRIAGRAADGTAAYVATGIRGSGAELLEGKGDFLVIVGGTAHRVQIARVSDREIYQLPRAEHTPRLDLGDYDLDRVLDVVDDLPAPEDVAVAMVDPRIRQVKDALGVGQRKARLAAAFARRVLEKLDSLGRMVQ